MKVVEESDLPIGVGICLQQARCSAVHMMKSTGNRRKSPVFTRRRFQQRRGLLGPPSCQAGNFSARPRPENSAHWTRIEKRATATTSILTSPTQPGTVPPSLRLRLSRLRPNLRIQTRRQSIQWATLTLRQASGGSWRLAALCCSFPAPTPASLLPSPRSSTTSVYVITEMDAPENWKEAQMSSEGHEGIGG